VTTALVASAMRLDVPSSGGIVLAFIAAAAVIVLLSFRGSSKSRDSANPLTLLARRQTRCVCSRDCQCTGICADVALPVLLVMQLPWLLSRSERRQILR